MSAREIKETLFGNWRYQLSCDGAPIPHSNKNPPYLDGVLHNSASLTFLQEGKVKFHRQWGILEVDNGKIEDQIIDDWTVTGGRPDFFPLFGGMVRTIRVVKIVETGSK